MRDEKPYISIVSPVYQAEEIVDELIKRIKEEVQELKIGKNKTLIDVWGLIDKS